jgi:hypothetical protein
MVKKRQYEKLPLNFIGFFFVVFLLTDSYLVVCIIRRLYRKRPKTIGMEKEFENGKD